MKIWKKEKKVVALLLCHTEEVRRVLDTAETSLGAYLDGKRDPDHKMNVEVDRQETEADKLRREIQDTLYAGAYLPHLREDIYRLVESIDDIADSTESCTDFFNTQQPDIPTEFREAFRELIHTSLRNFEPLQQAVKDYFKPKGKLDELRKHCARVGKLESKVDKLEEKLSSRVFDSDLDLSSKMHLQQCIRAITLSSDRAEDAADVLERVGIKSVV